MTRTLPRNVHFKNGRYYFVRTVDQKARWTPLSVSLDESLAMVENIRAGLPKPRNASTEFKTMLRRRWTSARWRSVRYSIEFGISFEYVFALADAAGWACVVTGLPFSLRRVGTRQSMPFSPSIDRIESDKGYVEGNVRVVCLAANYALNEWGDAVFAHLLEAYAARKNARCLETPLSNL